MNSIRQSLRREITGRANTRRANAGHSRAGQPMVDRSGADRSGADRSGARRTAARRTSVGRAGGRGRRGSTLIVVLGLMGLMALLGFVFFSFAAQERENSENFSEGAKLVTSDAGVDADTCFDWGLQQLIVGPSANLRNSALWGGRHSLITNMLGRDLQPYSGRGINLGVTSGPGGRTYPIVDMNYDGVADAAQDLDGDGTAAENLLQFNDSPAANSGRQRPLSDVRFPDPDVDYTYPDINNVFLAHFGTEPTTGNPVLIPSFHRPQYLRDQGDATVNTNWHSHTGTATRVMRPHPNHQNINPNTGSATGTRFATAAEIAGLGLNSAFPFVPAGGGSQGVYDETPSTTYGYDVDVDQDPLGIREAVYLDLDFPIQTLPSGEKYVPLFAFTVYDADSLLNLNAHGNLAGDLTVNPTQRFGGVDPNHNYRTEFISKSNLGLSPAEVNAQMGLTADPPAAGDAALEQYRWASFGRDPVDRYELANMDWMFLNRGRYQYASMGTPVDSYPGRYSWDGQPGQPNIDDNSNGLEGSGKYFTAPEYPGGIAFNNFTLFRPFGQPLDFLGSGRMTQEGTGGKVLLLADLTGSPTPTRNRWQQFDGYHNVAANANASPVLWSQLAGGQLTTNTRFNSLVDDPAELIVDRGRADRLNDRIFDPDENAFLQMWSGDVTATGAASRAGSLMPYNFRLSSNAVNIRKRFTTESWDRKQYGLSRVGVRDFEFNADAGETTLKFPPRFGDGSNPSLARYGGLDPFRGATRLLLETETLNPNPTSMRSQMRLSLNRVAVLDASNKLHLRPLQPFPDLSLRSSNPTEFNTQYATATGDRQALARDIYVLLYTLGNGNDSVSPATTDNALDLSNSRAVYSIAQLRDMAQFAANYVDALDTDDVLTRFVFDKNLFNGWDPAPGTSISDPAHPEYNADYPEDRNTEVGVVYGVEAQQLALSETLAIKTNKVVEGGIDQNADATEYDDRKDRYFTFVELRNVGIRNVDLSTQSWQVIVRPSGGGLQRAVTPTPAQGTPAALVGVGGTYVIASAGDAENIDPNTSQPRPSYFMVDPDYDPASGNPVNVQRIAPRQGLSLDLITADTTLFDLTDSSTGDGSNLDATRGALLNGTTVTDPNISVEFILRRRVDVSLPGTQDSANNPWVIVDRFTLDQLRTFALSKKTEDYTVIRPQLQQTFSRERQEPLNRSQLSQGAPIGAAPYAYNSIGADNVASPAPFSVHQPHADRDFASKFDLLGLPLYRPDDVTLRLPSGNGTYTAGVQKFLTPDYVNLTIDPPNTNTALDNRWYRLLEFVEVPSRMHRHSQFGNPLQVLRNPGLLNLNTLRYPESLAALLDDQDVVNFTGTQIQSQDGADSRGDWWPQFLQARDGYDVFSGLYLPGTASSRPFRPLALANRGNGSIEQTLLRRLPADVGEDVNNNYILDPGEDRNNNSTLDRGIPQDARLLFEVGTVNNHVNGELHHLARNRLLSKIAGNTTMRSNVFFVFMQVDFFEAAEPTSGTVKIGGKRVDSPAYRGFFVIDRSQVEQGLLRLNPPQFNFKSFVIDRQKLN